MTDTTDRPTAATSHTHLVPVLKERRDEATNNLRAADQKAGLILAAVAFSGALVDKLPHVAATVTAGLAIALAALGGALWPRTGGWQDHRGHTPGAVLTTVEANEQPEALAAEPARLSNAAYRKYRYIQAAIAVIAAGGALTLVLAAALH
jgi:hypothetical protein